MAQRIRGILFDLGDTLLDFGSVDIPSMFEAGARLAYDFLKGLNQPLPSFAKFHRQQLWAIRWNYFFSRLTRREFDSLEVIGRLGDRMGHDLSEEQTMQLAWLFYEPLSRCASLEEGALELLGRFRKDGIVLGLISNTFVPARVLDRHLAQKGLLDLLSVRVYSCEMRYRKPDPRVFREALKRGDLRPEQTLFVGDSPYADVKGANRAGMISVLKDPTGRHDDEDVKARHRIRRLADLGPLVGQYNGPG
jgi:HAD superfamily hydrolase (TIGR01509 family)